MQRSFKTEISDFSFRFIVALPPPPLLPLKTCHCEEALEKFYFLLFLKEKSAFENGRKKWAKNHNTSQFTIKCGGYGMDIINLRQSSPVILLYCASLHGCSKDLTKIFCWNKTRFPLMMTSRKIILTLVLYSKLFEKC